MSETPRLDPERLKEERQHVDLGADGETGHGSAGAPDLKDAHDEKDVRAPIPGAMPPAR